MTPKDGEKATPSSSFAGRLAYVVFLKHLELGEPPTKIAIGEAAAVTGEAVSNWIREDRAPKGLAELRGLANYAGTSIDWIEAGKGDAPDGELWARWCKARAREAVQRTNVSPAVLPIREKPRASQRRKR